MSCIDHGQKGNYQGYGHSNKITLHRKVFKATHGYLPVVVMHTCDNSRCINPEHLIAGDWDKNNKDRAAKGRSAKFNLKNRKITQEQAEYIKQVYSPVWGSSTGVTRLAKQFNVDPVTIYNILKGRTHFANLDT